MGWFDLISQGVVALSRVFCFTFVNNSNIRVIAGVSGAGVTQALPIFVAKEKCLLTQLKIDTRMTGVRSNGIDDEVVAYDYERAGLNAPVIQAVPETTVTDPTYRQVTLVGMALIVVRANPGDSNVNYNIPAINWTYSLLSDTVTSTNSIQQAPAFQNSNMVVWSNIRQLAGVDTYREVRGGFVDAKFPGPIRLAKGDYLQMIYFGTDNYMFPTFGSAGVWGRITGLISWEYDPDSVEGDGQQKKDGTIDGPAFRKFAQV
jgi:hypothetical protein